MVAKLLAAALMLGSTHGMYHMKMLVEKRQNGSTNTPMVVTNSCPDTIYPGILTQGGVGPAISGFRLSPGANQSLYVSEDWQGRIWGRTNCTFDESGSFTGSGRACSTGDCGPVVECTGTGENPATLAEFTLIGDNDQSYYDISLVDGYNLPMAIVMLPNGNSDNDDLPPNQTNPSCVGSVGNLASQSYNPYNSGSGTFLGTNSSYQLPFLNTVSSSDVADWCPWDLQVNPPQSKGDGVYPYPDGNVQRPPFNPCFSACAKYNEGAYCCTGKYDGPSKCSTNYYAKAAKSVCPDAYSFPYDDQDSTFIVPAGAGFQVVLCPGGLSTTILASAKDSDMVHHSKGSAAVASNVLAAGKALTDGLALRAVLVVAFLYALLV